MFKEHATEKLIEYIQALPDKEQKIIARKISAGKKSREDTQKKMLDFITYSKKLPARLPKDYKFDREEANER